MFFLSGLVKDIFSLACLCRTNFLLFLVLWGSFLYLLLRVFWLVEFANFEGEFESQELSSFLFAFPSLIAG